MRDRVRALAAACAAMAVVTAMPGLAQTAAGGKGGRVERSSFGTTKDGQAVDLYTLTNANGVTAKIITYGALLTELHVPDRTGTLADVVLGFKTLNRYEGDHPYFGATIGRVANRIAKGRFRLGGQECLFKFGIGLVFFLARRLRSDGSRQRSVECRACWSAQSRLTESALFGLRCSRVSVPGHRAFRNPCTGIVGCRWHCDHS